MLFVARILLLITLFISFTSPCLAAQSAKKSPATSRETIEQYVEDLKKNPGNSALREKIIKLALNMKTLPATPENAERHLARGTTFAQKASDPAGYKKAISELEAASNSAPWLALAYFNLGVVQEKAGLFNEAIQNLRYYLMADPDAKNAREVKNKIYALEADLEDVKASKNSVPPAAAPAASQPLAGAGLSVAGKKTLALAPEKQLNIIKMPPPEKKTRIPGFIGSWAFKDTLRGEELTIEAFEISKNANNDIVATVPKRTADYESTITAFEISDKTMKIEIHWRMKSVAGYWKNESYNLTLSDDGSKLSGLYTQKSVGGKNIEFDRTLFRKQ